jgi:excisionase family DNA binding protein
MKSESLKAKETPPLKALIHKSIINKAKAFQKNKAFNTKEVPHDFLLKVAVPDYPDVMTTEEAAEYLRVSKTTLQNYEDVGYLKALRHTLPGKSRGKVTWLKSELDKVKYGAYKNN